jgi:hypothetical protein
MRSNHSLSFRSRSFLLYALLSVLFSRQALLGQTAQTPLTARQVIERIQKEIGTSAGPGTVDTFKAGDPETPITGVATTFTATLRCPQESRGLRQEPDHHPRTDFL